MPNLKMSSPWILYYKQVNEMFKNDPNVLVIYDDDAVEVKLYVTGEERAAAIDALLPDEQIFGNMALKITVYPANTKESDKKPFLKSFASTKEMYEAAFETNPAFHFAHEVRALYNNSFTYVVFANTVVQYFNDNLSDIYGQCSTLYETIASYIFDTPDGVYYCTDKPTISPFGMICDS